MTHKFFYFRKHSFRFLNYASQPQLVLSLFLFFRWFQPRCCFKDCCDKKVYWKIQLLTVESQFSVQIRSKCFFKLSSPATKYKYMMNTVFRNFCKWVILNNSRRSCDPYQPWTFLQMVSSWIPPPWCSMCNSHNPSGSFSRSNFKQLNIRIKQLKFQDQAWKEVETCTSDTPDRWWGWSTSSTKSRYQFVLHGPESRPPFNFKLYWDLLLKASALHHICNLYREMWRRLLSSKISDQKITIDFMSHKVGEGGGYTRCYDTMLMIAGKQEVLIYKNYSNSCNFVPYWKWKWYSKKHVTSRKTLLKSRKYLTSINLNIYLINRTYLIINFSSKLNNFQLDIGANSAKQNITYRQEYCVIHIFK